MAYISDKDPQKKLKDKLLHIFAGRVVSVSVHVRNKSWQEDLMMKYFTKIRSFLVYLQIVLTIGFSCVVEFPELFEMVLVPISILNLNFLSALGIHCWFSEFDYVRK